jgi:ABC-type sugar transport system ATPase subunit
MTTITLDAITKRYDNGFEAVRGVSLTLPGGTFTVLLGPSGCGKTTTLRMIAGLETISSGDLLFNGERMNDAPPNKRDIGMVFQNYALYPHLTVFENIAFPLRIRRENRVEIERRVREVAALTDITDLLQRKPKQISGGQRQRVALARAIVRKPRVFLFDEPLSNLDAQLRTQMRAEITRLQRFVGSSAVYVTHDQVEAMTMADNIVVMNNGIVQQTGTPQEIYTNPQNLFTAGFVGSPAINFFEGICSRTAENGFVFRENGSSSDGIYLTEHALTRFAGENNRGSATQPATLGVRPEHLAFAPFDGAARETGAYTTVGNIVRVEFLGYESLVHLQTTDSHAVPPKLVRLSNDGLAGVNVEPGAQVQLFIKPAACLLFDAAGERL